MKNKVFAITLSIICISIGFCLFYYIIHYKSADNIIKIQKTETENLKLKSGKLEKKDSIPTININNTKAVSPLTEDDFIIKNKKNYIKLEDNYEDLITNEKIIKIIPLNEQHLYTIYIYKDFKLIDQMSIVEIQLETPVLKTARGIRIGDTSAKVIKKYGSTKFVKISKTSGYYNYCYKYKFIKFFINKLGKVKGITIEIL